MISYRDYEKMYVNDNKLLTFFYSICINITSFHTTEINVAAASQCMSLISLHVLCICVNAWSGFSLIHKLKHS